MADHTAGPFYADEGRSFHMKRTSKEAVLRQLQDFSPGIVLWAVQGGDICKRLGQPEPPVLPEGEAKAELERLFGNLEGR